jgi:hypothetical protein
LAQEEPPIFEDKSLTLHNVKYNKEEKKLQIEKFQVKNNKISQNLNYEVDVLGVGPSKLHITTRDALSNSISK